MKAVVLVLLISLSASARQYMQCSPVGDIYSFDRIVINLNDTQSTLFITNGVHLPDSDRIEKLKKINFAGNQGEFTIYKSQNEQTQEILKIPTEIIGEYSNYFKVLFTVVKRSNGAELKKEFSCFSAIYND